MRRAGPTLLSLFLATPPSVLAGGATSAELLKLGAGARAAALAGAQTAVASDAYALHWNPAGLSRLISPEAAFMHNRWFEDVRQQWAAAALPARGLGTFAVGLDRLTTEEFNGFDAQGSLTGALTSGAGSVAAGWGRTLWGGAPGGLAAGVAAKALREEHAGVSARGFAVDLGFQARPWGEPARRHPWLRRTSAGLSLKNMGTGPRFDRESAPLPLEAVFGLGYAHFISGDSASFAADLRRVEGEGMSVSLGAEYWHDEFVALRAGWRSGAEDGPGLSAGAGFRLSWTQIDYAWTGFGEDLGAAHRFSFSVRFGRPAPDLSEELFRFHAEEGRRQMEAGNCARATLSFDRALKIRPGDAETLKRLLECGERLEAGP